MPKNNVKKSNDTVNVPAPITDGSDAHSDMPSTERVTANTDVPAVVADNVPVVKQDATVAVEQGGEVVERPRTDIASGARQVDYGCDDPSMSGGYASVTDRSIPGGKEYPRVGAGQSRVRAADNKMLLITVIVMSVLCIVMAVCSSIITAHFMRSGEKPPVINAGDIQQNIAAVVETRKSCVAEISCDGLRGSAVITKREGSTVYAVTNAHVLRGYVENGFKPLIRFYGEDEFYEASAVLGYDLFYDVAVFTVDHETKYTVYNLDGNDEMFSPDVAYNDGDYVVSIGNAFGFGVAAYDGIISRKSELLECVELFNGDNKKKWVPVMRTTAVINAGMSGGAVFDMQGRFVGLGTYRMSSTLGVDTDSGNSSNDVEDTGFATPISVLYSVYKRILNAADGGEVGIMPVRLQKPNTTTIGFVGTDCGFSCEYRNGELVVVAKDVATPNPNVEIGDVITHINGKPVTTDICAVVGELLKYNKGGAGNSLSFSATHGGHAFSFTVDEYRYAI